MAYAIRNSLEMEERIWRSREPLIGGGLSSNRLPGAASKRNRLISSFNLFLASRNVINKNSTMRYDKMLSERAPNPLTFNHRAQPEEQKQLKKEVSKKKKKCMKQSRVCQMLSLLLSGRHKNRLSLLLSLLRKPVILAGLFSFLLALSLMILYALSFHHQQTRFKPSEPLISATRHLRHAPDVNEALEIERSYERALTVQTECGLLVGAPEQRAIAFRGVAYASPPVGARRWTRPRPIWHDPQLCKANATIASRRSRDHCAQVSPLTRRFSGSEDCLYLDIYTPQLNQVKKLPVMVYVHGGFLTFGSSGSGQVNWLKARPSAQLASELNVLLVAFNYRLQALGFMTLAELARNNGPDGSEGNYGLWDQLVALNWVKRNIEPFGGDPTNIVLFGPDSASALPLALLGRESAQRRLDPARDARQQLHFRDLFRAAWLINPALYYELPYELASQHYERLFLNQSPCAKQNPNPNPNPSSEPQSEPSEPPQGPTNKTSGLLGCLMRLSAEQVVRNYLGRDDPAFRLEDQNGLPIHGIFADQFVTVDRELVFESYPFGSDPPISCDGCRELASSGTDLLIGSSAQAVEYWPCPRNLNKWNWSDFERYVSTSLNSFSADTYKTATLLYNVTSHHDPQSSRASPKETYLTMVTDIRQLCPANELAESMRIRQHRVKRYIVQTIPSSQPELSSPELSANHNAISQPDARNQEDVMNLHPRPTFAFHTWDLFAFFGFQFDPNFEPSQRDLTFQTNIRQMVKKFVHDKPVEGDKSDSLFAVYAKDARVEQVAGYKERECKMWRDHLDRLYAWVS